MIIPRYNGELKEVRSLEPRIVKIRKGRSIAWINHDLKVYKLTSGDGHPFLQTDDILPGKITTVKIDSNHTGSYQCTKK